MTILEAINKTDAAKPNGYTKEEKIEWLSELDGKVKAEIIDTHEGTENITFTGYDENTNTAEELLIPAPYSEVYLRWLEAKIDYANGEYDKFNNSIVMYNTAYSAFADHYNRTHMPKGHRFKFF